MHKRKRVDDDDAGHVSKRTCGKPEVVTLSTKWFAGLLIKYLNSDDLREMSGVTKYLYAISREADLKEALLHIEDRYGLDGVIDATYPTFKSKISKLIRAYTIGTPCRTVGTRFRMSPVSYWLKYDKSVLMYIMDHRTFGTYIRMDLPTDCNEWVKTKYSKAKNTTVSRMEFDDEFKCNVLFSSTRYQMEFIHECVYYQADPSPTTIRIKWIGDTPDKELSDAFSSALDLEEHNLDDRDVERAFLDSI